MQKALVTGGTGFLGKQIAEELKTAGYEVETLGRQHGADIICNLDSEVPGITEPYSLIVHAAGKAHEVPQNGMQESAFFNTNFDGTVHLCKAIEKKEIWPESFVFISSVAVYGVEEGENITETHPLQGTTPYAKSKILAEDYLQVWCEKHNIVLSILRLPLIAGPNPPGNLGIMINAIKAGKYFNIGEGTAKKSMVLGSDVGRWIPKIARVGGIYNLTDGYHPSFAEMAGVIASQLNKRRVYNIPNWLALPFAMAGSFLGSRAPINCDKLKKITATLTFDDSKARQTFGWDPKPVLENFTIN